MHHLNKMMKARFSRRVPPRNKGSPGLEFRVSGFKAWSSVFSLPIKCRNLQVTGGPCQGSYLMWLP